MRRFLAFTLVLLLAGCAAKAPDTTSPPFQPAAWATGLQGPTGDQFGDYWYQGVAEITSYDLEQARYGEVHPGEAVLIYVTEDFSEAKQVKLDNPAQAGDDAVKVLKLNASKKFFTGVYPYSMMTSTFTPVYRADHPHTLKVTTTAQEWCGHAFSQLNLTGDGYHVRQFSYFESEGDQDLSLGETLLEDELWNTIRLNPTDLPTGDLSLVPGTMYQRLRHLDWGAYDATATLADGAEGQRVYTLTYPDLDRTLAITFSAAFPHEIEGWTETYASGFGPAAQRLTTTATRKARVLTDYWTKNNLADAPLRAELQLTEL